MKSPTSPSGQLVVATLVAACAASALDLAVFTLAGALWDVPATFVMLAPASIVVAATVGSFVAGLGVFALRRLSRKPIPIFAGSLGAMTLLSLTGPFMAMAGQIPGMPHATIATGATMVALHLVTGGVMAAMLLRRGGRARDIAS